MAAGGVRKGAGRPALPDKEKAVAIAYKVKPDAAEALDRLAIRWGISKSKALQRAIIQAEESKQA